MRKGENAVLPPKQTQFAHEYVIDLNGAQAAIRAGYSARSATERAYELLRMPEIAALIEKLMAERAVRTQIQQDAVINELAHLAFSCVTHYTVNEETGDLALSDTAPVGAMAAVQTVNHRKRVRVDKDGATVTTYDTEVRLWDKPKALFLLGRHVGLFADRVEHVMPSGPPITRVEVVVLPALPPGALAIQASAGVIPAQDDTTEKG